MTILTTTMAAMLGASAILVGQAAAEPATKTAFNGTWAVQIRPEAGPCDASYHYAIAIRDGQISHAGGAGSGAVITGRIGADGAINLGVQAGPASAGASGRLKASAGSGTRMLPMLGCSGRWTAQRRALHADAS